MDMSSGMTMTMPMYFNTATNTPLYSSAWTPATTGQYAGTCIFLIVLASISRFLSIYRYKKEENWHAAAINRRYIVVANQEGEPEGTLKEKVKETGEVGVLTARGKEEDVKIIATKALGTRSRPWRLSVDVPRAVIYTVQAGLGYLLMLAVMTFNVGYFLSVLAGLFVGEVFSGRYAPHAGDHF